jgi:hypothetical protein
MQSQSSPKEIMGKITNYVNYINIFFNSCSVQYEDDEFF